MRRCIHIAYAVPERSDRESINFATRDSDAAALLRSALQDEGYVPGDTIIEYPFDPNDPNHPLALDRSFFHAEDVIFVTTRPPKDDPEFPTRKPSYGSGTELEQVIFGNVARWLKFCSRSHVRLSDTAARINPMTRASQSMLFKVHGFELTARAQINGHCTWQRFTTWNAPTIGFLVDT